MTIDRLRAALLACVTVLAFAACEQAAPPAEAPAAAPEEVAEVTEEAEATRVLLPVMSCAADGFIKSDATRESLAATHGAENIADEELGWVDSTETALVLFPGDPAIRTELFWLDKTSGGPRHVRAGGPESQWIGPGGLFIGASLADVEAANGGPFELMGFQNHNAGEVVDWLGGALAAKPGETCEFAMTLGLPEDLTGDAAAAVSGDPEKVYRSDSPEMRAAKPFVDGLALNFFDPS